MDRVIITEVGGKIVLMFESSSIVSTEPIRIQFRVFPPAVLGGHRCGGQEACRVLLCVKRFCFNSQLILWLWTRHSSTMSTGVSRTVLHRLRAAGSAPAASSGTWSRLPSSCCRLPAGPRCEARRGLSVSGRGTMNVFNREMKKRQKNWAASLQDGHQYDYLRDEVGAHRHCDVTTYNYTSMSTHLRYRYWGPGTEVLRSWYWGPGPGTGLECFHAVFCHSTSQREIKYF